jgi:hypothetical protein
LRGLVVGIAFFLNVKIKRKTLSAAALCRLAKIFENAIPCRGRAQNFSSGIKTLAGTTGKTRSENPEA